jgi:small acid-soluble spore protein (thioredoxin-like protein)
MILFTMGKIRPYRDIRGGITMAYTRPNPDDRSDNVEKLQDMVENTIHNIEEANDSLEFATGEQRRQIKEKNRRREESIESFRNEIQDEAADRTKGFPDEV